MNWISSKERLPDDDLLVLIATNDSDEPVWLGYYDTDCWRNAEGFEVEVSHWMELPEVPSLKLVAKAV